MTDVQPSPPHAETPPEVHDRTVTVTVNEQPVMLEGKTATGGEIKHAAIAQGVLIQQNFVLQEELPNGTSRIIGGIENFLWKGHDEGINVFS